METNVAVPMRDGTILYADIYRPDGRGPFPVLLQRTPYDKNMPLSLIMLDPLKAARHGYVVAIQDTRGRYTSGGECYASRADRKQIPEGSRVKLAQAVDAMESAFSFLPLKEFPHLKDGLADYFYDWLAHPDYDDYWKHLSIEEYHARITVPALNIGGWYDIFLGGTIRNYLGMREQGATQEARRGQKLLIGPWQHGASRGPGIAGDHYFG